MAVLPAGSLGRLAARTLFLMSSHLALPTPPADRAQYAAHSSSAVTTLQSTWYDAADGLWNGTGWWNSANCLTTLAEFALLDGTDAAAADLAGVFANTFANAQKVAQTAAKAVDAVGLVSSSYARVATTGGGNLTARDATAGFPGFLNNFYDDEGWWALAWLRAYDATGTAAYLTAAEAIFADMQGGATPASCGGGIWWSKDATYKNAIANELYLAVAAGLARRAHDTAARAAYRATAAAQWAWFRGSGLISAATGLVSDGLTIRADGSCVSNNQTAWSYNQGVVVGGLVELHRAQVEHRQADAAAADADADADVDDSLLPAAIAIAAAAMNALAVDGILHESCEANNGTCGGDGPTFKGVFARNLYYLHRALVNGTSTAARGASGAAAAPDADQAAAAQAVQSFLLRNADAIWARDRDAASGALGLVWSGPPTAGGAPTPATHAAAMDCLVAAVGVA